MAAGAGRAALRAPVPVSRRARVFSGLGEPAVLGSIMAAAAWMPTVSEGGQALSPPRAPG